MPDPETDPVFKRLVDSATSRNPDEVESAVGDVYRVGVHADYVPPLIDLLLLDWHTRHEDIVGIFQELKDDRATEALFQVATKRFGYLDYDEFDGLARKCTWALADIGSPKSREKLQILSGSENELIAGYAKKRLERWEDERKRNPA